MNLFSRDLLPLSSWVQMVDGERGIRPSSVQDAQTWQVCVSFIFYFWVLLIDANMIVKLVFVCINIFHSSLCGNIYIHIGGESMSS